MLVIRTFVVIPISCCFTVEIKLSRTKSAAARARTSGQPCNCRRQPQQLEPCACADSRRTIRDCRRHYHSGPGRRSCGLRGIGGVLSSCLPLGGCKLKSALAALQLYEPLWIAP